MNICKKGCFCHNQNTSYHNQNTSYQLACMLFAKKINFKGYTTP